MYIEYGGLLLSRYYDKLIEVAQIMGKCTHYMPGNIATLLVIFPVPPYGTFMPVETSEQIALHLI